MEKYSTILHMRQAGVCLSGRRKENEKEGETDMGKLDGQKPAEVFHWFEEISRIPRGSGNVEGISGYLKSRKAFGQKPGP